LGPSFPPADIPTAVFDTCRRRSFGSGATFLIHRHQIVGCFVPLSASVCPGAAVMAGPSGGSVFRRSLPVGDWSVDQFALFRGWFHRGGDSRDLAGHANLAIHYTESGLLYCKLYIPHYSPI